MSSSKFTLFNTGVIMYDTPGGICSRGRNIFLLPHFIALDKIIVNLSTPIELKECKPILGNKRWTYKGTPRISHFSQETWKSDIKEKIFSPRLVFTTSVLGIRSTWAEIFFDCEFVETVNILTYLTKWLEMNWWKLIGGCRLKLGGVTFMNYF